LKTLFHDPRSGLQKYAERRKKISGEKGYGLRIFILAKIHQFKTTRDANVPKGI
jgi:hypothetical protein